MTDTQNTRIEDEGAKETFGTRLRGLLEERGISQTEFAERVGMDRTELNRTINDKRQPKPDELIWIAQALDMSVDSLLEGLDLPAPLEKTKNELQRLAERVLSAEAERDRALAEVKRVGYDLERERAEWESAHAKLVGERQQEREQFQQQKVMFDRKLAEGQNEAKHFRIKATREIQSLRSERDQLKAQLDGAHRSLAAERASKVAQTVVAGLAGTLLGFGLGGPRDDDDDENE